MRDRRLLVLSDSKRNLVRMSIKGHRRRMAALRRESLGIGSQDRDDRDFGDEQ